MPLVAAYEMFYTEPHGLFPEICDNMRRLAHETEHAVALAPLTTA